MLLSHARIVYIKLDTFVHIVRVFLVLRWLRLRRHDLLRHRLLLSYFGAL